MTTVGINRELLPVVKAKRSGVDIAVQNSESVHCTALDCTVDLVCATSLVYFFSVYFAKICQLR